MVNLRKIHSVTHLVRLLLVLTLLVASLVLTVAQDTPQFRIGVIDTSFGAITTGAQLAAEIINEAGGIEGADGTIFDLEIVVAPPDENGDITTAIDNISQSSVVAVLGPATTEQVLDNLTALQNIGKPVITPAIGDTILASDSRNVLIRSRAAEVLYGRAMADFLITDLQANSIATVQLDIASTAGVVGFTTAASALNVGSQRSILFETGMEFDDLVIEVLNANADATVIYGPPALSGEVFVALREAGYPGFIGYNFAGHDAFKAEVPVELQAGIISASNWTPDLNTLESTAFLVEYTRLFGEVPDAISAASYDSIFLIAEAIGEPGELGQNILEIEDFEGSQGILNPADLITGETSDNVVISIMNEFGGSEVVARYSGGVRAQSDDNIVVITPTPESTPTPQPTPTLDGVYIRVISNVLNVRSGPGLNYDVIGRLNQGELVRVIGGNADFSWAVIEFRAQQAWISTASNLVEVLGDPRTVPIIAAPPTPTPAPPTNTPVPSDIADIVVTNVTPANVPYNTAINADVTIQNIGGANAGSFAVATSFEPYNAYAAQNINGLAAGASMTIQLSLPAITETGNYEAIVIVDLNEEINEGPAGEANNRFSYFYKVDRASLTNATTLGVGASIDIDGGGADIVFTAAGLETVGGCVPPVSCIGLLSPTLTWNTAHYDAITAANGINANAVLNVSLTQGSTLGLLTNQGNRAVIRIDSISPGGSVTITYRFY